MRTTEIVIAAIVIMALALLGWGCSTVKTYDLSAIPVYKVDKVNAQWSETVGRLEDKYGAVNQLAWVIAMTGEEASEEQVKQLTALNDKYLYWMAATQIKAYHLDNADAEVNAANEVLDDMAELLQGILDKKERMGI